MDIASAQVIGAGLAAIGVGRRHRRRQRFRLVPRERAAQPGGGRRPAGPPVHRLRRRRTSGPDRLRRGDHHPLRALIERAA